MKLRELFSGRGFFFSARRGLFVLLCVACVVLPVTLRAAESKDADSDAAWAELTKAAQPPPQPVEWQTQRPSDEEVAKFREKRKETATVAADKAKDFYVKFPKDAHAADARKKEYELLQVAAELGSTNSLERLGLAEAELLKDPNLTEESRFEARLNAVHREAGKHRAEGMKAVLAAYENGAHALLKEFPKHLEIYQMLLEVASGSEADKARQLAQEITDSPASAQIKIQAAALLKKLDALGKPLPIKFTAVDGSRVDVTAMKGKVVLVDFWATWCVPCLVELPNVKKAYEKFHPKGLEIVGISFDNDKSKLQDFIAKEKTAWPQYFDGAGWGNKIGAEYGILGIPAMWLVDKKGMLRDVNAREDLAGKVEKLLAE